MSKSELERKMERERGGGGWRFMFCKVVAAAVLLVSVLALIGSC